MWRNWLEPAGRFVQGLFGAALLGAAVSALSDPQAGRTTIGYLGVVLGRLENFARFNFGSSVVSGASAWSELAHNLPATLELVVCGALIALVLGIPVGVILSAGRGFKAAAPLIQIVAAAPVFCAGLGLLWLSQRLLHTPASAQNGLADIHATLAAAVRSGVLPMLTVGAAGAASVQLALRHAVAGAITEPYRSGLRALGLSRFEIDHLFLFPQVASGLLNNLGALASALLASTAVAEWVFGWPGAAALFLKSTALHDWEVVGLILLVFASFTTFAELVGTVMARLVAESGVRE
jgi:peptide/nickel transport system permease protein